MSPNIVKQLKQEEGEVLHAYKDHLGFLTIGVGILIDKRKGGGITNEESDYLLVNRLSSIYKELVISLPWLDKLNEAREAVLVEMAFQMGIEGLLKFKDTLAKIKASDFEGAASSMLSSLWSRQTPGRANRMAKQMLTGEWVFRD